MSIEARLDAVIDRAIDDIKTIVGTVVLVAKDGQHIYSRAAGFADREARIPMSENTIFRLASVTKPMVAATALAMVERKLLSLDDRVDTHLPYFTPKSPDGIYRPILIRQLLSHTSGLAYDFPADPTITTGGLNTELDLDENFSRGAKQPLLFAPGTGWQYSCAIDVLGAVIARITGGTLEAAVERYVTGPLGMKDTAFHVTDESRLAVPYGDARPEPERMSDPHVVIEADGNRATFAPSRIFNAKAFQSGGAGASGTAPDFLKFLEAIRQGGGRILRPETVAMALSNQIGDLPRRPKDQGQRFGFFGAIVADPKAANSPVAPGTVRWGGSYGHEWFIDRHNGLSVVGYTNTALEGCTGQYTRDIRDAIYG
jgi:CubicO group peptidase (beta-lactamase class C family)